MGPFRVAFLDPVRCAVVGEEVQERDGVESLRSEHAGARPDARLQQLHRDHSVDSRLPTTAWQPSSVIVCSLSVTW